MPEADLRRLVLAIRSAIGIEALVWLTDVAGLSRDDAVDLMRGRLVRSSDRRSPTVASSRRSARRGASTFAWRKTAPFHERP